MSKSPLIWDNYDGSDYKIRDRVAKFLIIAPFVIVICLGVSELIINEWVSYNLSSIMETQLTDREIYFLAPRNEETVYSFSVRNTSPFSIKLIYDNNFFLLKYSIGYIIGEPPLGGVAFEFGEKKEETSELKQYNVLLIDSINALGPFKWNDSIKNKELIFPFSAGANELDFITKFFNEREEVKNITVLSSKKSTREAILSNISKGTNHIIHFVGNIFYSKWNPNDSFFITNDNQIVTIREIYNSLTKNLNKKPKEPFLFFNTQIYDIDGKKLGNVLRTFGEITEQFDYDKVLGIISRNYPIFDDETKEIIANFYTNLFSNNSQGISLLKAKQVCMANKMTRLVEEKFKDLSDKEGSVSIDLQSSLAISSYMLFGKPWKKLN